MSSLSAMVVSISFKFKFSGHAHMYSVKSTFNRTKQYRVAKIFLLDQIVHITARHQSTNDNDISPLNLVYLSHMTMP